MPTSTAAALLSAASFACGLLFAHATRGYLRRRRMRRACLSRGLKQALVAQRNRHFCGAQRVSYSNTDPLLLVRGQGCRLEDEAGRVFLDTRNNVCHVGHAHPAVAAAVADQVATLNTNTRYLHPTLCQLASRLLSTFPAPLSDGSIFVRASPSSLAAGTHTLAPRVRSLSTQEVKRTTLLSA